MRGRKRGKQIDMCYFLFLRKFKSFIKRKIKDSL